ncbi:MAG: hypothetical protein IJ071_07655 [Ruminococcus sp.]|nr:hypothetical protein [Ruminococcus sp.]
MDDKYSFRRAEPGKYMEQLEAAKNSDKSFQEYHREIDEKVLTNNDHALMLGRIWALFGEPDDPSMYEDFYHYTIAAENGSGKVIYFEVFEYMMPKVSGICDDANELNEAGDQLCELINNTSPADYEWTGVIEEDFPVDVIYAVKGGVPDYTDSFIRKLKAIEERYGKKYGEVSSEEWERLEYAYEHDMTYEKIMAISDEEFDELYHSDTIEEEKKMFSDAMGISYEKIKDMTYKEFNEYCTSLIFGGSE